MTGTPIDDLDRRLRDLRLATSGKVRPSPALLARVESSLDRRTSRHWPQALAVAALILVVVVVVRLQPGPEETVATRRTTREAFVSAMSASCRDLVSEWVPGELPAVGQNRPGPDHRAALERFRDRVISIPGPEDAPDLAEKLQRDAIAAHSASLTLAVSLDAHGRPQVLRLMWQPLLRMSTALAAYGVEECRDLTVRLADKPSPVRPSTAP